MRRRSPHETLTDPKNENVLGTLTPKAWGKLAILGARNQFYRREADLDNLPHPMETLVHEARQTSGSIHGEHRKDLVEAMRAAQVTALGLGMQPPDAQRRARNAENGHEKEVELL